jgi:5-(carboxyamino)imidazole ribonucleotide mutase
MNKKNPLVGIIMGSDSDLSVMKESAKVLEEFQVPYELSVVSAHRTPERMVRYAKQAEARGLQVLIAGAGGSAHLPGMVASLTALPVIGVPIKTAKLEGLDALLSIVQMPAGIPVATVAINGAKNAGLLACRILGAVHGINTLKPPLQKKLLAYSKKMKAEVEKKAKQLERLGYKKYLSSLSLT